MTSLLFTEDNFSEQAHWSTNAVMRHGKKMTSKGETLRYHFAELSSPDLGLFRAPGPGLGNLLFPISRAVIGAHLYGGEVVLPTMRQIKVGTFLRGERDKRTYGNIFRERTRDEWRHWMHAKTLKKKYEDSGEVFAPVIVYTGLRDQFHSINGYSQIISRYLEFVAKKANMEQERTYDIAMHIRRGDFISDRNISSLQNYTLPLSWYSAALEKAQDILGSNSYEGILFTDGKADEFIQTLCLAQFAPEPSLNNALSTLQMMSKAKIIIASQSTFSLWAQYLGNCHGLWPAGFELQRYKKIDKNYDHFI